MILVKEVNMISMDGAKARIVMTSKIRTFADKDPESESVSYTHLTLPTIA